MLLIPIRNISFLNSSTLDSGSSPFFRKPLSPSPRAFLHEGKCAFLRLSDLASKPHVLQHLSQVLERRKVEISDEVQRKDFA